MHAALVTQLVSVGDETGTESTTDAVTWKTRTIGAAIEAVATATSMKTAAEEHQAAVTAWKDVAATDA